ncbi:Folic acid synthesis protein fol1 [Penicillium rolfsii]|nr:Folic acid synthesis protein fol1 [Penicillium rolfsii]
MLSPRSAVHIPQTPAVLDSVRLRDIELPLPAAPDPWHRPDKPQPCTASLKLSYSSAVAAAEQDDVSLSLDYGKLFRRLETDIREMACNTSSPEHPHHRMISVEGTQREEMKVSAVGQDPRVTAGIIANCGLGLLDETAAGVRRMAHVHQSPRNSFSGASVPPVPAPNRSSPIAAEYGRCEVWLHLPKALLRAEEGLKYRSVTVWGYKDGADAEEPLESEARCPVVLEEEFRIEGIRCYCILGVNSHERVEKQAVIVSLSFEGPGQLAWGSTVVDTYVALTRAVAEKVDETTFQTVEALATFIARIVTVDFGNERVTVRVEKPSALAFVQRSGVEITRSQAFFKNHDVARR